MTCVDPPPCVQCIMLLVVQLRNPEMSKWQGLGVFPLEFRYLCSIDERVQGGWEELSTSLGSYFATCLRPPLATAPLTHHKGFSEVKPTHLLDYYQLPVSTIFPVFTRQQDNRISLQCILNIRYKYFTDKIKFILQCFHYSSSTKHVVLWIVQFGVMRESSSNL